MALQEATSQNRIIAPGCGLRISFGRLNRSQRFMSKQNMKRQNRSIPTIKMHTNDQSGFGGSTFVLTLKDGSVHAIKGPWDGAWSPSDPVPPYHDVTLVLPNGRFGMSISTEKYQQLIEEFCPEAELVEVSGTIAYRVRIKRKGQPIDYPTPGWHGTVLNQQIECSDFQIEIWSVPETGESMWKCEGLIDELKVQKQSNKPIASPERAISEARQTILQQKQQ